MMTNIRLNIFAGAFDKEPKAQDDYAWPALCDELELLVREVAPSKSGLVAFTLGTLSDTKNINANYVNHTALAIDVDVCDWPGVSAALVSHGLAAFVYGSPSDPNPDGTRRVRIVSPVSEPIAPDAVKHCRMAFAELLGIGPGQGVESAMAVSQLMFIGQVEGSPEREIWRFEGSPVDVDALTSAPLSLPWRPERKTTTGETPTERVTADPNERTAALLEALAPFWEPPGEGVGRRQVLRALGGYLAKRGWSDAQIAAVARGLETERPEHVRMQLMADAAHQARSIPTGTAGWSTLVGWKPKAASVIEAHAKHPREPDGFEGVFTEFWQSLYTRRADRTEPPAPHAPPPAPEAELFAPPSEDAEEVPLFLRSRDGSITLIWEGDDRGHRPIANSIVRTRVGELGYDQSLIPLRDGSRDIPVERLLEIYGASYASTSYAFNSPTTRYDPRGEGSVTIGYPHSGIKARFDADVDTWLMALAGPHYERLAVWIASCCQAHIDRLAACVVIMGAADTGKSMFGHAVARMWGRAPAAMALVCVQFNGAMLQCPILVDEEAQLFGSKALSTKKFRDIAQSTSRGVELKGKERVTLIGAQRFIVNCNGMSDLRFSDLGGPEVIKALRDRLLVVDAGPRKAECAAALERLRVEGSYLVDLDRVAGHMLWLGESLELPVERFAGAGGDNPDGAILAGHVSETAELWELFRDWLDGSGSGASVLFQAQAHDLCANPRELAIALTQTGRGWDLTRVRAALAPFHTGNLRPHTDGRPRLWMLDTIRICASLELDAESREVLDRRLSDAAASPHDTRLGPQLGKFRR